MLCLDLSSIARPEFELSTTSSKMCSEREEIPRWLSPGHYPSLTGLELPATEQPFATRGKLTRMLHKPCCDDMRWQLEFRCADHADLSDCPDSLVVLLENPTRFGIRVHDGGSSFTAIRYCPWCGANLSA